MIATEYNFSEQWYAVLIRDLTDIDGIAMLYIYLIMYLYKEGRDERKELYGNGRLYIIMCNAMVMWNHSCASLFFLL